MGLRVWNPFKTLRQSEVKAPAQVLYLVFGEQGDSDPSRGLIDPIVATFVSRERCTELAASAPGPVISWDEMMVRDAGEHLLAEGDTNYLAHDWADTRHVPGGREVIEFVAAPSPTDAYYSEANARRATKGQSVQRIVIGEIAMSGIGSEYLPEAERN